MNRSCRYLIASAALACMGLFGSAGVLATTITVTSLADSGPGTLRQAIVYDAQAGDTINFAVTGTITLTTGQLVVNKNLVIAGPGVDQLAVSGNHTSRVFRISGGTNVTITDMSIVDGTGGIDNRGILTLTNSTVSGNTAYPYGGGIDNRATLTLINSTVSGNSANPYGGGLLNFSTGTMILMNSTVSGNSASQGGGIFNNGALTLTSSTVTGNSATYGPGIGHFYGTLTLKNTLVASQAAGNDCYIDYYSPTISHGHNLDSDGTCRLTASTDLPNTDPLLGPLADNGGPTLTHALLAGSPAIDHIPDGTNGCGIDITTDQRGVSRPQDGNLDGIASCDIGAFEYVIPNIPPIAIDDTVATDQDVPLTIDVLANDSDPDDDPLTVESVTQGTNGTVMNNGDGTVTYTRNPGFNGTDSYTYTINDGKGGTATASVYITITVEVNVAPDATLGVGVTIGAGSLVGSGAVVGDNVVIGNNVTVDDLVTVGDGTSIGDSTWIKTDASVGADVVIAANVTIGNRTTVGDNTRIGEGALIKRDVAIGADINLGTNVTIGRFVVIGDRTSIGDRTQINALSRIGVDCTIGSDTQIGRQVTIGNSVTIGNFVMVKNRAVIPDDTVIPDGTTVS